jgi:NADPH:quinone reductase-like Zn-dependent oxidoreductase
MNVFATILERNVMKAIVYEGFGSPDILKCQDIEKPTPGESEVLIRVHAASINPLDWKLMKGGPLLVRILLRLGKPKIRRPGVDVAGEVEAIGRNVKQFKPGDEVFGTCMGAFAEYATSASAFGLKSVLVKKPENVTFEQAASAPVAGLTALQGLRDKGRIQAGQKVLINGAAGGVGTFAVQIAKLFGAHVTGVCSTGNVNMVRSIGADRVIDYTQDDFTKSNGRYDIHFGLRWEPLVVRMQARFEFQRDTRLGRSARSSSRYRRSRDWSVCVVAVRDQEDGLFHRACEQR